MLMKSRNYNYFLNCNLLLEYQEQSQLHRHATWAVTKHPILRKAVYWVWLSHCCLKIIHDFCTKDIIFSFHLASQIIYLILIFKWVTVDPSSISNAVPLPQGLYLFITEPLPFKKHFKNYNLMLLLKVITSLKDLINLPLILK